MTGTQSELQRFLLEGIDHHEGGRRKKAETAFRRALKIDPNQPIALYLCGRMAHDAGRHVEAVELLSRSVAGRADHVEGQFFLAESLVKLGRFDHAISAYEAALKANEKFPQGHRRLGEALVQAGRAEDAIASFHRALAMEPDRAQSHFCLGVAQQALGQIDGALGSFERALAIDADMAEAAQARDRLLDIVQSTPETATDEAGHRVDTSPEASAEAGIFFTQGNLRLRQCRYGRMLYFTNDDYIGKALDLYGEFSEGEAGLFRKFVSPGMTAVDLGANMGVHTVCLAKAVRPGGTVMAFEPQRVVFQMLRQCRQQRFDQRSDLSCRIGARGGLDQGAGAEFRCRGKLWRSVAG